MNVTVLLDGKFHVGQVVITSGAKDVLSQGDVFDAMLRHVSCDWGDVEEEDWKQNDDALEGSARLLSQYRTRTGTRFWIITEADRSVTTVLLPEEY